MYKKSKEWISGQLRTITIEPMMFLFIFGFAILIGAQIPTNILIYKICKVELNNTEEICNNLSEDSNKEIQDDVQTRVNNFFVKSQWISSVPRIIFSLYGGPISDQIGRKPIILIPILGHAFMALSGIINYAFIETLPLEFLYLENISAFFGGLDLYYLGVYSYGTSVTTTENRAYRISRLDGTETIAMVIGIYVSSIVYETLGFYGNYGFCGGLAIIAVIYLTLFVKEPNSDKEAKRSDEPAKESKWSKCAVLYLIFAKPLIDIKSFIFKKRTAMVSLVIAIQLFLYCAYIIVYNSSSLTFLYMLDKFTGFTASEFAYFSVSMSLGNAFFLIIIMPIVSGKYQVDDALLLTLICAIETLSFTVSAFVTSIPAFYAAQLIGSLGYCKYSVSRSLLAKCCQQQDIGKLFSIQSVMMSITLMLSTPVIRELYNNTLASFSGAFLLLCAALLVASGFGNFFLYTKGDKMTKFDEEDWTEQTTDVIDYSERDSTLITTHI